MRAGDFCQRLKGRGVCLLSAAALLLVAPLPAAAESDFFTAYRSDWDRAARKLIALAAEVPAELYSWRPQEGVRSVSEVLIHVAVGNYFFPSALGVEPPEELSQEAEKTVTEKAEVIAVLKRSIDHVRTVAEAGVELDRTVALGTTEMPARELLLVMIGHLHEHLGQSIAYARANGIKPPWDLPTGPPPEEG